MNELNMAELEQSAEFKRAEQVIADFVRIKQPLLYLSSICTMLDFLASAGHMNTLDFVDKVIRPIIADRENIDIKG